MFVVDQSQQPTVIVRQHRRKRRKGWEPNTGSFNSLRRRTAWPSDTNNAAFHDQANIHVNLQSYQCLIIIIDRRDLTHGQRQRKASQEGTTLIHRWNPTTQQHLRRCSAYSVRLRLQAPHVPIHREIQSPLHRIPRPALRQTVLLSVAEDVQPAIVSPKIGQSTKTPYLQRQKPHQKTPVGVHGSQKRGLLANTESEFSQHPVDFQWIFYVNQRAWTYSWTQKPSMSLGSGRWTSLDASRSSVIGATRQRTTRSEAANSAIDVQ